MSHRYGNHLALAGFDAAAQQRISEAHVVVVGLGGIGAPAALYLAAAGVGTLTLCDFDRVSEANLSRQVLYGEDDVGQLKVEAAAAALRRQRKDLNVVLLNGRIDAATLVSFQQHAHLWLDASDNYATRLAVNVAAEQLRQRWLMAAAIRREGQLAVFDPAADNGCYACLYGDALGVLDDCAGAGVLSTVAGAVALAAAQRCLEILATARAAPAFSLYDGAALSWQHLKLTRRPDCDVCGA